MGKHSVNKSEEKYEKIVRREIPEFEEVGYYQKIDKKKINPLIYEIHKEKFPKSY